MRRNNVKWYGRTYMKQLTTKNNKTMSNVKTNRTTRLEYPRYYNVETDKYYRRYDEKSDIYDIEIRFRDRKNVRWYRSHEEIPHFSKLHTLKTRLKHRIRRIIYSIIP